MVGTLPVVSSSVPPEAVKYQWGRGEGGKGRESKTTYDRWWLVVIMPIRVLSCVGEYWGFESVLVMSSLHWFC